MSFKKGLLVFIVFGLGGVFCSKIYAQASFEISQINVIGNFKTKESIILRELKFSVGNIITLEKLNDEIEKSRQNLINTNLFLSVEITKKTNENNLYVTVNVKERWYIVVLPNVMLSDRNINEWWYDRNHDFKRLTYGISAKHFNLTGNNDQLNFKAYGGFIPYFEASYSRPYIDKRKRVGFKSGVFFTTQHNMAFRTWNDKLNYFPAEYRLRERHGIYLDIRLRNAYYHFHSFYLNFTSQKVNDTIAALNPYYFGNGNKKMNLLNFTYTYRFDRRDNRQYALKGHFFQAQMGNNFIFSPSKMSNQMWISSQFNQYFKLKNKIYFETALRGKITLPKYPYYALMNNMGYENNLVRGYELYVIDGQSNVILKSTLKYELFKGVFDHSKYIKIDEFKIMPLGIYPNIYFDMGYAKNYFPELSNSKLSNTLLKGGGVGLDLATWYNTNLKMNYSINQLHEKRFYFVLSTSF